MRTNYKVISIVALVTGAVSANAGSITANYSFQFTTGTSFIYNSNPQSPNAALIQGVRTDLPAGIGVDSNVPKNFDAYCVEVGETIGGGSNTHAQVLPLLGSVTASGGITGPVTFTAARTKALETLWGSYKSAVVDAATSTAFQIAQWEITFDTGLDLTSGLMTASNAQAQTWLTNIKNGTVTNRQALYHLKKDGLQDLVTPVPEPGTIAALGLGIGALLKRRARKS